MVAEITDHTNIAHAYAYLPISWATGQALGYVPELFELTDSLNAF